LQVLALRAVLALHPQGVCRQTLARRAVLALILLFAGSVWADTMQGVVIVVIDGDTVLFKPDHYHPSSRAFMKVRLADIDAPEADQPRGVDAAQALKEMALRKHASLEIVATDIYGRKLGRLAINALPLNAELVRRGHAWAYDSIPRRGTSARSGSESFRASSRDPDDSMRMMQREARRARIGLWQDADPVPPWIWRRQHAAD